MKIDNNKERLELSIVVPVYNEKENVSILCNQLTRVCDSIGISCEFLFVDDGSSDATYEALSALHRQNPRIRLIRFRRNFGQTAAMSAGFEHARGRTIISMDGDLQNDPADIPRLMAKLEEGHDVVCGWRKNRQDKFWSRRLPSVVANWLIGLITGVPIHDNGCSVKAYRASVIKQVQLYGELHRFIPAMSTLAGAKAAEIIVNHHARKYGKSKYGISRIWRVVLDIITVKMIVGFATRPALWFGLMSVPFITLGLLILSIASFKYFENLFEAWVVMSTTAFLSLFLGVHLLSTGIIAELFVKTGDYSPRESLNPTLSEIEVNR